MVNANTEFFNTLLSDADSKLKEQVWIDLRIGGGRKTAQFADHVFWGCLWARPNGEEKPVKLRLNMFYLDMATKHPLWKLTNGAQLVEVDNTSQGFWRKARGARKEGRGSNTTPEYDPRYLSGKIESKKGLHEALKFFINKRSFSEEENLKPLMTAEDWIKAKREASNRTFLYGLVENGSLKYEEAKWLYEHGGEIRGGNVATSFEGAKYRVDVKTLNIHPPREVIESTLKLLAQ